MILDMVPHHHSGCTIICCTKQLLSSSVFRNCSAPSVTGGFNGRIQLDAVLPSHVVTRINGWDSFPAHYLPSLSIKVPPQGTHQVDCNQKTRNWYDVFIVPHNSMRTNYCLELQRTPKIRCEQVMELLFAKLLTHGCVVYHWLEIMGSRLWLASQLSQQPSCALIH